MSEPILPLRQWPAGIQQASVPANDNALRLEALSRPCLGVANDASGTDADGDVWIVGDTPAGAFAAFDENDIVLYHVDTATAATGWYPWAPVQGVRLVADDVRKVFDGADWIDDPSVSGGGGGAVDSVNGRTGAVTLTARDVYSTIVTDSTTARNLDADDMGKYLRFTSASAKALTVQDNADEAITIGAEVHGRNAGAGDLTITEDTSVTVNPPAGGTLVIPEGGTFTLKKVATDEWDLFGVTVAAP